MPAKQTIYTKLIKLGLPKHKLDRVLHYLVIKQRRDNIINNDAYTQVERHPWVLFQYYKNFQLLSRLKGKGLCLLKTQYAKKPKNPE